MRTAIKTHPACPLGNPHPLSDCHTPKENPKLSNYSFLSFSHCVFVSVFAMFVPGVPGQNSRANMDYSMKVNTF